MNSFAYGDIFVKAASVAEALEIIRLLQTKESREYLKAIDYGHVFNDDRKCICGLTLIDFHIANADVRPVCPGKQVCPRCKGKGWLPVTIRKPRRAFSVRMLKCTKCQPQKDQS